MKVTMHFDLNKDGEQEALDIMREAGDARAALQEFNEALRRITKYEDNSGEEQQMATRIRTLFTNLCGEYL